MTDRTEHILRLFAIVGAFVMISAWIPFFNAESMELSLTSPPGELMTYTQPVLTYLGVMGVSCWTGFVLFAVCPERWMTLYHSFERRIKSCF